MSVAVLLSIKPNFAYAIFHGTKRFEFRKSVFRNDQVTKVLVYASAPISLVIGEFEIDKILSSDPEGVWEQTKVWSGISKNYFLEYFRGRRIAHAIGVSNPSLYEEPKELARMFDFHHPPQSFRYVTV